MKALITSLIVILSLQSTALADSGVQSNKMNQKCMVVFNFCIELKKSILKAMIDHSRSGSDLPFVEPMYTDYHCTQDFIKMEKNGECKSSD